MEAQRGGLLHTNMTYRRRRREETVNLPRHTLGCHLCTEKGKRRWEKLAANDTVIPAGMCPNVIQIPLQMGQKHSKTC